MESNEESLHKQLEYWITRAMDAEKDNIELLYLLSDIRNAAGYTYGKLMQDELVDLIRELYAK